MRMFAIPLIDLSISAIFSALLDIIGKAQNAHFPEIKFGLLFSRMKHKIDAPISIGRTAHSFNGSNENLVSSSGICSSLTVGVYGKG